MNYRKQIQRARDECYRKVAAIQKRCPHNQKKVRRRMDGTNQGEEVCLDCDKLLRYGPYRVLIGEDNCCGAGFRGCRGGPKCTSSHK